MIVFPPDVIAADTKKDGQHSSKLPYPEELSGMVKLSKCLTNSRQSKINYFYNKNSKILILEILLNEQCYILMVNM